MKNIVHLIDCMEFMKDLPDNHYDLAIVDPPYGIGNFIPQGGEQARVDHKDKYVKWNENIPVNLYFDEIKRISINNIIWGANYYNCFSQIGGAIIWDKKKGDNKFSMAEIASCSLHKSVQMYRQSWNGFQLTQRKTIHPCQKPVELYKWLIHKYAKPGQTIFDSHVGSGSLRIACHDLGFDFEGCEIDEDYWKAQEERYQNYIKQVELFGTDEIQELVYEKKLVSK